MKIFVCIKQVPDTETKIKLNDEKTGINETGIKWVMNPYDEIAMEEALLLKAKEEGSVVVAVSVGPKSRLTETLRSALAMGADEAILIDSSQNLDFFVTAQALSAAITEQGSFDMIFTGKLAIDDNGSSVSQALAEFLNIPHSTVISKFDKEEGTVRLEREVEGGTREVIQLVGPSVIGVNKGLNNPRYPNLRGIMAAKKKSIKEMSFADLGLKEDASKICYKNYELPPEKPAVKIIEGDVSSQVSSLVKALREEAKVL